MNKTIRIAVIGTVCLATMANAQQDALVSHYMFNTVLLNPGYAGSQPFHNVTALFRRQWVGFDGAPVTQLLSYHGPVKGRPMGLGLILSNDRIGTTTQQDAFGQYAYHLRIGEARLGMGLRAGFSVYRSNLTTLRVWDVADEVFLKDIPAKVAPNFGFGLHYYTEEFFINMSIPHLINYNNEDTRLSVNLKDRPRLARHYYLGAGYLHEFTEDLALKPSLLFRYTYNSPPQADINTSLFIYSRLWLGISYRTGDCVIALAEVNVTNQMKIGYAYDITFSAIRAYSYGSHEIMMSFDFGAEARAISRPRIF